MEIPGLDQSNKGRFIMKNQRSFGKLAGLLVIVLSMLACGSGDLAGATETPTLSPTPLATNTATARPTSTPKPTKTPLPTPAPLNVSIESGDFSYTVIDAISLRRIYPGGTLLFSPNPGYLIMDIGVRIENKDPGTTVSIPWEDVYVTEANGDSWYPIWGTTKFVDSGTELDPYSLGISSEEIKGINRINFTGDAYLRLIYIVTDNENQPVPIIFGIGDAPQAEFIVEQPN
jgi:hypothetical protein